MTPSLRVLFLGNWPLASAGDDSGFAFFAHFQRPPRVTLMGTYRLGPITRLEKTWLRFYLVAPLVAFIRSFRHDLVVAYSSQVGLPLSLLFHLFRRRTKLVVFDVESFGRVEGGSRLRLVRYAAARIDRIVHASARQREYYERVFPEIGERLRFIPIGIGPYRTTRPAGAPASGPILAPGHHGRAFRDWAMLLRAFAPISGRARLLIVGRERLREIDRDGVPIPENVEFRPFVPADDLGRLVEDAPFVVLPLPERRQSLGQLSALFCMSMGRAVIATRVMGVEDYIEDGVSGLLVPPGDDAALARAMRRLLDDPDEASRFGVEARRRIDTRFNDRAMGRAWEVMIDELMGAVPASGGQPTGIPQASVTHASRPPQSPESS
ncbi:glycosyltransferase family 4 protein [bacterium]|nr:glycosyltransferase family 4 protein [bacterium]